MGRRSHRREGVRGVYFQRMPLSVKRGGGLALGSRSFWVRIGMDGRIDGGGCGGDVEWWMAVVAAA